MTAHAWANYDDALTPWRRVEVTDDNGPRTITADVFECGQHAAGKYTDEELQEPCAGA